MADVQGRSQVGCLDGLAERHSLGGRTEQTARARVVPLVLDADTDIAIVFTGKPVLDDTAILL